MPGSKELKVGFYDWAAGWSEQLDLSDLVSAEYWKILSLVGWLKSLRASDELIVSEALHLKESLLKDRSDK